MEQDQQDSKQEKEEMTLESSFNLLVSLARNTKLSYLDHAMVDKAVKMLHEALNSDPEQVVEEGADEQKD
jgi:regulator of sirC expression with transglutaminase-like and TPR domain